MIFPEMKIGVLSENSPQLERTPMEMAPAKGVIKVIPWVIA